jgi:hypothetical protein
MGLHEDYGLTDKLRLAAIKTAEELGVAEAARIHKVSRQSIYAWRKLIKAGGKE